MARQKFYAVASGRNTGIYSNWSTCSDQVNGYSRAQFKSFNNREDAQNYIESFSNEPTENQTSYSDYRDSYAPSTSHSGYSRSYAPSTSHSGYSHSYAPSTSHSDYSRSYAPSSPEVSDYSRASSHASYSNAPSSYRTTRKTEIYTDGSAHGNQNDAPLAGYGVYFGPGDSRNAAVPLRTVENTDTKHTNNRAELHAVGHALREIKDAVEKGVESDWVIHTDSMYVKNSMERWLPKWRDNDWNNSQGNPVANRDIIENNYNQLESLRAQNVSVKLSHVKGHGDSHGNTEADRLANLGADKDSY